jgi:hypothetical protein
MATIIVDRISVVNPQLAPIIGYDAPSIMAGIVNSHAQPGSMILL